MIISDHLCGVAIAYNDNGRRSFSRLENGDQPLKLGRLQGSLISYQKRQIADASEWLRTRSIFKPRIFVCTTSPNWGAQIYEPQISKFCHNLRNGYGCENYIWVREFNKRGAPHYHFIADMDYIHDPVALSLYWSGLFGYHTKNSVRLGTAPDKNGRRHYVLNSKSMAFYMAKYLGKNLRSEIFPNSWHSAKMPGRSFGISRQVARQSAPVKYDVNYHYREEVKTVLTTTGPQEVKLYYPIGTTHENEFGEYFNKHDYQWTKSKDHEVFFGRKKTN